MSVFTYLPDGKDAKQTTLIAVAAAVGIHLILGIFLLVNADFTPKAKPQPKKAMQVIDAVVIDQSKLQQQVDKIRKEKAATKAREDKRIKDLERRADDAKKKRQQEADKIKKLEKDRKKKEVEKKKADAAAKKSKANAVSEEKKRKKIVEERKKSEKAASDAKAKRLKAEAAEKKAADERRRKKLADDKRKKAEDAKRKKDAAERAEQENLLEQQMQQEMAARQNARSQQVMSEVDKYSVLMVNAINNKLIKDDSMRGKTCVLKVSLASNGLVLNATSSKGDRIVCDAAIKAVFKVVQMPMSKDPLVYNQMTKLSLTIAPEF